MYILPDTVRTNAVRVKSCKHIQLLHKVADQLDLFFRLQTKGLWDDLNDQSQQSSRLSVGQSANHRTCQDCRPNISWQLSMATLSVASGDPVVGTNPIKPEAANTAEPLC